MRQLPPVPPGIGLLDDFQIERIRSGDGGKFYTPEDCVTCGGDRQFKSMVGGEVVDFQCDCEGQWQLWAWMINAGIQLRHQRLAWADLVGVEPAAIDLATDYIDNPHYLRTGRGLFLYGQIGRGKSSLAYLIVKGLLGDGVMVHATSFENLIDSYTKTFDDKDDGAWFNRNIRNVGLLLIDDLGRESSEKARSLHEKILDDILKHRVGSELPTIICSTRDPEWIVQRYGEGMRWFLEDAMIPFEFKGENFFHDPRFDARKKQEIELGLRKPVCIG